MFYQHEVIAKIKEEAGKKKAFRKKKKKTKLKPRKLWEFRDKQTIPLQPPPPPTLYHEEHVPALLIYPVSLRTKFKSRRRNPIWSLCSPFRQEFDGHLA